MHFSRFKGQMSRCNIMVVFDTAGTSTIQTIIPENFKSISIILNEQSTFKVPLSFNHDQATKCYFRGRMLHVPCQQMTS